MERVKYDLPDCLPDELLLSRLIRHVSIRGEEGHIFVNKVFGSSRISIHPFLTSNLNLLANAINESSETLLFQQTLAPLFMFYLPTHAEKLAKLLQEGDSGRALRESQLPSFGCGSSLLLKCCPLCVSQDLRHHGVAYWHRTHQIPGVTACSMHPVHLQVYELNMRQRVVTGLLPLFRPLSVSASKVDCKVARFGAGLLRILSNRFNPIDITALYRTHLAVHGLVTSDGHIRRAELMKRFNLFIEDYAAPENGFLPRSLLDYRYLSQLLEPDGSHHPFRHLLFSCWLFEEPIKMFRTTQAGDEFKNEVKVNRSEIRADLESQCLQLLHRNYSLNEIYRITGKSRCYLKRLGTLNNIIMNLLPKIINSECQKRILKMAYSGTHRRTIAALCKISLGSVEQTISSEPGLVEHRKRCHFESRRRRCRAEIAAFMRKCPKSIQKDIRAHFNRQFYWLYANDRSWLKNTLPMPSKPQRRYGV